MTQVDDIFQKAFSDHENRKFQEAADGYQKVLSMDPDHASTLHLLGLIEFDRKNYETAIPLIEKSLDLAPDEFQWILNYGMIMKMVGSHEISIACYQKALSKDPGCIDAQKALADVYQKSEKFTEALKIYYNLLCDNPRDREVGCKYADTMKAMGRLEEADRFLRWVEEK